MHPVFTAVLLSIAIGAAISGPLIPQEGGQSFKDCAKGCHETYSSTWSSALNSNHAGAETMLELTKIGIENKCKQIDSYIDCISHCDRHRKEEEDEVNQELQRLTIYKDLCDNGSQQGPMRCFAKEKSGKSCEKIESRVKAQMLNEGMWKNHSSKGLDEFCRLAVEYFDCVLKDTTPECTAQDKESIKSALYQSVQDMLTSRLPQSQWAAREHCRSFEGVHGKKRIVKKKTFDSEDAKTALMNKSIAQSTDVEKKAKTSEEAGSSSSTTACLSCAIAYILFAIGLSAILRY